MPNRSRQKGDRAERALKAVLLAHGCDAKRVPLSGSAPDFGGDLLVDGDRWEVKRRAHGFALLYRELDSATVVAVSRDRGEWIVALKLDDYLQRTQPQKGER